jgi:hypothetical protein
MIQWLKSPLTERDLDRLIIRLSICLEKHRTNWGMTPKIRLLRDSEVAVKEYREVMRGSAAAQVPRIVSWLENAHDPNALDTLCLTIKRRSST